MLKKNLNKLERIPLPVWRKMAFSTWSLSGDASTYAKLSLPVDKVLKYIEQKNSTLHDFKISLTHFTGRALAEAYKRHSILNRMLRFGKFYQRGEIDLFFLVATDPDGHDLTGKVLYDVDQKNLSVIASELRKSVKKIRVDRKEPFGSLKKILNVLPVFIIKPLTSLMGFILYSLNIQLPFLKMDRNAFGCAIVTSVGSIGIEQAYAPLIPFSKVPLMMSIGCIQTRLKLVNKEVVEEKFIEVGFTVDHRLIDGIHGSKIAVTMRECFDNPELFA